MTALSIQPPFPIITDIDGQPLEDGYIYIGVANLPPIGNPITVYWDAALTLAAAQPIRTIGGYPMNSGTPARLYVNSNYSILVQNKNGSTVYSAPTATERYGNIISSADVTFIQSGTGAVTRTAQAKMREPVSFEDFGAVGDGVSDDLPSAQNALSAHDVVELIGDATYNFNSAQNGLQVGTGQTIRGNGQAELLSTSINYRPLDIDTPTTSPSGVVVEGVTLRNNVSSTDDWAPVRFGGAQASMYHGNHTKQSYYGSTFSYSIYNDRTEIRTKDFSAVGNLSQGNATGYEIFSVKNAAFAGNVSYKEGTQAFNHGIRVTGYGAAQPAPGTDLKVLGVAIAGHAVNNYANGISQQTGVYGCAYSGIALTNTGSGIQLPTTLSSAADVAKGNVFSGIAIHSTINGMRLEKAEKHVFSGFAIREANFYGVGLLTTSSTGVYGTGRYNRFDGAVYDHGAGNNPLLIEGDNNRVDITIADVNAAGNKSLISGNFNVVTVTGGGFANAGAAFLHITGDNNIVTIAANDVAQMFSEVLIDGNNNVIICNLDISDGGGEVLINSGTGNQIIGYCRITSPIPAGNRIDGVFTAQAQGITTATTDVSGDIDISYGYDITGLVVNQSVLATRQINPGQVPYFVHPHSKTTAGCKIRVFDTAGLVVPATSVTIAWKVTAT